MGASSRDGLALMAQNSDKNNISLLFCTAQTAIESRLERGTPTNLIHRGLPSDRNLRNRSSVGLRRSPDPQSTLGWCGAACSGLHELHRVFATFCCRHTLPAVYGVGPAAEDLTGVEWLPGCRPSRLDPCARPSHAPGVCDRSDALQAAAF